MTGIERLRRLAGSQDMGNAWTAMLAHELCDIADQIERETEEQSARLYDERLGEETGVCELFGVEPVDDPLTSLRRHVEGLRDTIENLRLELGEARDEAAWVREHGGLDSVKKLLDWVVGHCSTKQQLDFDFWLSGRVMHELGFEEDMADRDEVERRLLARLMPEGYEWPRYESGEPLRYEDRYVYDGRVREVWHVDFDSCGEPTILNRDGTRCHLDKGEHVKRPAPKVLDAEGVECNVGDAVWWVHNKTGNFRIIRIEQDGKCAIHDDDPDEPCGMTVPSTELTHKRPVFDTDGVEIRVGEMVYSTENGDEFTVMAVSAGSGEVHVRWGYDFEDKTGTIAAKLLTHRAPVLAADGKPLREGETVWHKQTGRAATVKGFDRMLGEPCAVIDFAGIEKRVSGKLLTHERPVVDTWERIEEDAGKDPCGYFGFDGEETCGKCPASGKNCEQTMARDIVRRCRALAERERGE